MVNEFQFIVVLILLLNWWVTFSWRDKSFGDLAVDGMARPVPSENFHITLFRRCKAPPLPALEPPDCALKYQQFALLESQQGRRGVSYHPLQYWQLGREKQGEPETPTTHYHCGVIR
ncbi:MAG: hypothetical protein DRR04_09175 [Gammaproteobacteria bacterium]|nr:MAG: hypothetical protein DRQ97_11880 [Gammaproteobacteria bacterium]RLA59183.1 MAG: hypothetical protein DRR04_09175 [Gammaproteobacteria bacterium]